MQAGHMSHGPSRQQKQTKKIDILASNLLTDDGIGGTRTTLASESGRVPAISTLRWPVLTVDVGLAFTKGGMGATEGDFCR